MIFSHTLWRGLVRNLCNHGVPPFFAIHIAGACYPDGAQKETRRTGFVFAKPIVSYSRAHELVDRFLATPPSQSGQLVGALLTLLFGQECVNKWISELEAEVEQAKREKERCEQAIQEEANYQEALRTLGVKATATRSEVAKRYKKLCQRYHPDRHQNKSDREIRESAKRFNEITLAYEVVIARLETHRRDRAKGPSSKTHTDGGGQSKPRDTPSSAGTHKTARPSSHSDVRGQGDPSSQHQAKQRLTPHGLIWSLTGSVLVVGLFALILSGQRSEQARNREPQKPTINAPRIVLPRQTERPKESAPTRVETRLPKPPPTSEVTTVTRRPEPTVSLADVLAKAITESGRASASANYEHAYAILHQHFTPEKPKEISDTELWKTFLKAHSEALDKIRPRNEVEYWRAVHNNGVAWHELMKQAMASRDTRVVYDARSRADQYYKRVAKLNAVIPGITWQSSKKGTRVDQHHEQQDAWRLVGHAMENMAILMLHVADYERDQKLYDEARRQIELCWQYVAMRFGANSPEYQLSVLEWKKQSRIGKAGLTRR